MMSLPVWLPRGLCPGGSASKGSLSGRGAFPGGLCQGDPPETPLYGKEWVVCILLECIHVFRWFKFTLKPPYSIACDNL